MGAKGRGDQISRIEADLSNHGLVTSPSFRAVTLDATVSLVEASSAVERTVMAFAASDPTLTDGDDAGDEPIGLTVGNLRSALAGVASVAPNATFDEAITKMLLNDFSQLAVVSGRNKLRGAVTWQSIAHTRHAKPEARLSDAIEQDAPEVRYDKELIDVLPMLRRLGFVFVRDEKDGVAGIVTTADVVEVYGEMAAPFFQIGEIDQNLRRLISRTFALDEVEGCCGRNVRSFDELSVGDYKRILESRDNWTRLGWPLDRVAFIDRLDEIRRVRNDVMHFNPDPLPDGSIDKLRKFNSLLRRYGD